MSYLPRFRYVRVRFSQLLRHNRGRLQASQKSAETDVCRPTARRLSVSYALDGLTYAALYYVAFVMSRALDAPPALVTAAGMSVVAGLVLTYPVSYFFSGRPKNVLFLVAAVLNGLAALGMVLFPSLQPVQVGPVTLPAGSLFLVWLPLYGIAEAIKYPARYAIFQSNFSDNSRSRYVGLLYTFFSMTNLAALVSCGLLLETAPHLFRVLFPAAMLLSAVSSLVFHSVPAPPHVHREPRRFTLKQLHKPFAHLYRMVVTERYFMGFELAFLFYGFGYMLVAATLPVFYTQKLGASYWQFGLTGLILNGALVASPLIGKWADRSTPTRVAMVAFAANTVFPVLLLLCETPPAALVVHGLFAAASAVDLMAWNTGPIFFSARRDSSIFVGLNATLTGVRAVGAYLLAGFLIQFTGSFVPVLLLAVMAMGGGLVVMREVHARAIRSRRFTPTASGRFNFVS